MSDYFSPKKKKRWVIKEKSSDWVYNYICPCSLYIYIKRRGENNLVLVTAYKLGKPEIFRKTKTQNTIDRYMQMHQTEGHSQTQTALLFPLNWNFVSQYFKPMNREQKRRRFNEALVNMLYPQPPPPPVISLSLSVSSTVMWIVIVWHYSQKRRRKSQWSY